MEDPGSETKDDLPAVEDLSTDEVLSFLEFGLWTAVVLIPILYWVNGPAVSRDQLYVRSGLAVVAYVGAPVMRWFRWTMSRTSNEIASPTVDLHKEDAAANR